jgi:SAM-dependent methyltransferase
MVAVDRELLGIAATAAANPGRAIRHLHYQVAQRYYLGRYDHVEGYRRLMQWRIQHYDAGQAVGGFDDGIGRLQCEFLADRGLSPDDRLLDVGCGSLRGGEHFMRYLDAGNYHGMDISREAIAAGRERLPELCDSHGPTLFQNDDLRFTDDALAERYDYALAQSVWTHLREDHIEECLTNIGRVLDGPLFATFFDEPRPDSPKNFGYRPQRLVELARSHGHDATVLSRSAYPHPRGQRMLRVDVGQ